MQKSKQLTATSLTGSSITLDSEQLPDRLLLLHWGVNETDDGPMIVNEETVAALNEQIARDTFARIVIDFDHQSFPGHPNYVPSPRHSAAHGDLEVVVGEGIYTKNNSWTPVGQKYGRDYCDISPVVLHTKRINREPVVVLGILSAALCNNGAVKNITAFSADYNQEKYMDEDQQKIIEGLQTALADLTEKYTWAKETVEGMSQQIATQEEVIASLQTRLTESHELTAASVSQARELAEKAVQPDALDESRQQVSALSARIDAMQKQQMIGMAVLQGKAVTLDEAAVTAMSAESLAQHIATLGATLPVTRVTPAGNPNAEAETTAVALSAKIETLIASIRKETGEQDFQRLWTMARSQQPQLFKK